MPQAGDDGPSPVWVTPKVYEALVRLEADGFPFNVHVTDDWPSGKAKP